MSEHTATVFWERRGATFTDKRFSRVHTWTFDGGATVAASASPNIVPEPYSSAKNIDPEEAFVAALSSCHMLTFLYLAALRGLVVERYCDRASGRLGTNEAGRPALAEVTLAPDVRYSEGSRPTEAEDNALHHQAHDACYLANAVRCTLTLLPTSNATLAA